MFTVRHINRCACIAAAAGTLLASAVAQQATTPSPAGEEEATLPPEERHIRTGIILLAKLYKTLAGVEDSTGAQAAVPIVVELTRELQEWGQMVPTLPLRSQEVMDAYELKYMPVIRKINDYLRVQGERLAAAKYYESRDLLDALLALYSSVQQ